MSESRPRVVYDCNIFLQYFLSPRGPGGQCVQLTFAQRVELFFSADIAAEIRELADKPVGIKFGLTVEILNSFIKSLAKVATYKETIAAQFQHPIDPDDSCYVNLALATASNIIVSRDRHLLNLSNPAIPWSADFRARFGHLRILTPEPFLAEIEGATRKS